MTRLWVVRATVEPPIEGDPEAALVTIQPDAETARARFVEHFRSMGHLATETPTVEPFENHEFEH